MARFPEIARFKPEARPATATGAQLVGPSARGPLAIGAFAIGRLRVREEDRRADT